MSDFGEFQVSESTEGLPPDAAPLSMDDGVFRCTVCGTGPLYYSGRGRHPTKCDLHKPGKGASSLGRQTPTMKQLQDSLEQLYIGLGFGVGLADPYSGMMLAENANKLAASWIPLAQSNKKVRHFLEKLTTGSGAGAVIMAHAMVAMPIMAHHDLLPSFMRAKKETTNS